MRASHDLTRVAVRFDEACLVPSAGLLPVAALAQRVDLAGLVDTRVRLASEAANSGTKALTVIGSILAGGDSIDDTDLLRTGGNQRLFDQVRAPSTIGSWLRAFKWSNVRELDAVSRELLARLWAAGAQQIGVVDRVPAGQDRSDHGQRLGATVRGLAGQTHTGIDQPGQIHSLRQRRGRQ